MEDFPIMKNYSFFAGDIEKIAATGPYQRLTVRNIGLSRGGVQRGYKEIKKLNFPGNIIDFICWISFVYFTSLLKKVWDTNREEKETAFVIFMNVLENDYKNSKRLMVVNPAAISFGLEKMSFSSKKDERAFSRWVRKLF